jgi:hypothetical protein
MAANCPGGLPPPPADLHQRNLPFKWVTGSVFRIHRAGDCCLHFGKGNSGRFDDPLRQFGVLYAALHPEAAFAEVFLRRLSLMLIRELDLKERVLIEITCARLRCVDLTDSGLRQVSCDNRIATEKPYLVVGQWSRGFHTHPQQPDGIIYRSRHNPRFKCLALFDRCQSRLSQGQAEPLMEGHRRAWTMEQVNKYDLALEPAV